MILLSLGSCSSVQAGMYLASIDNDNGETILQNEDNVKTFLENILDSYEDYFIKVFARTGVNFQLKRSNLLTHSYFLFLTKNAEYHTLSFYGTKMSFRSEGAWALDTDSDKLSYEMYTEGDNQWDVEELFVDDTIDVRGTVANIIDKIESGVTYYYKDHIKNLPNEDNCNTALHETIVLRGKG